MSSESKIREQQNVVRESLSRHDVMKEFEGLRQIHRKLYADLADTEVKLQEHKEVIKALKGVDPAKRCFYSQQNVLVERTVKEIFPLLVVAKEKLERHLEDLNKDIQESSRKVNEFQKTYNIQLQDAPAEQKA